MSFHCNNCDREYSLTANTFQLLKYMADQEPRRYVITPVKGITTEDLDKVFYNVAQTKVIWLREFPPLQGLVTLTPDQYEVIKGSRSIEDISPEPTGTFD